MDYVVKGLTEQIKIKDYLKTHLCFSTSLITKVKYGGVSLNGQIVHMRAMVNNGDIIKVNMPSEDSENIPPIDIPIKILFEDEDIIVVDKPKNMPTHPSRGNNLPTLANAVRAYLGHPFVFRAITRLDRDTAGIVLIAKNQLASSILSKSLKNGEFQKIYYGRVCGIFDVKQDEINLPIAREEDGNIKRVVREDGKPAITKYRVIDEAQDTSLVELVPVTGRTHQLRVHMAYIGHPLKNDFLYGERTANETYDLKCVRLTFPHPTTKEYITVTTDYDF